MSCWLFISGREWPSSVRIYRKTLGGRMSVKCGSRPTTKRTMTACCGKFGSALRQCPATSFRSNSSFRLRRCLQHHQSGSSQSAVSYHMQRRRTRRCRCGSRYSTEDRVGLVRSAGGLSCRTRRRARGRSESQEATAAIERCGTGCNLHHAARRFSLGGPCFHHNVQRSSGRCGRNCRRPVVRR